jgi:heptosyltransferase-2
MMPRTWKSALAPFLAGISQRTGFVGEARFGLLNDWRWGERALPRMIDRCASLTLAADEGRPDDWPPPQLVVPPTDVEAWRQRTGTSADRRPAVALAPGAVGASKRWPSSAFAEVARRLAAENVQVWVLGGPNETALAAEIAGPGQANARSFTGPDPREAILALAAADAAISNDSGLLHVAAAIGTPAAGIFGPTSPWHWAPLNPLAAVLETDSELACRPCHKPVCRLGHHRCMRDLPADRVFAAVMQALAARPT